MRAWLKQRPWIWIVAFFVLVVLFNMVLLFVAVTHKPIPA